MPQEEIGRYFGLKGDTEKLVYATRVHLGDTYKPDETPEFRDEDLYMFLMDADRLISTRSADTGLTFSTDKMNIAGTVTKSLAIMLIVGATFLASRRIALEGTRKAIYFRTLDTMVDTREVARSGNQALKDSLAFFDKLIVNRNKSALVGKRVDSYVTSYFPEIDQVNVDYAANEARQEQQI